MRLPELPPVLERAWGRVQDATNRVIAFFQPIVVTALLVIVYYVGVGLTRLVCAMFYRRVLRLDDATEDQPSYWRAAEGYDPDPVRLHKQH